MSDSAVPGALIEFAESRFFRRSRKNEKMCLSADALQARECEFVFSSSGAFLESERSRRAATAGRFLVLFAETKRTSPAGDASRGSPAVQAGQAAQASKGTRPPRRANFAQAGKASLSGSNPLFAQKGLKF